MINKITFIRLINNIIENIDSYGLLMIKYITPFVLAFLFFTEFTFPEEPVDYAIDIKITHSDPPGEYIRLDWGLDTNAMNYFVRRKQLSDEKWQDLATVDSITSTFTDLDIEEGQAYEYYIEKWGYDYDSYGHIFAGYKVPEEESNGRALILVDNTVADTLAFELERYITDLIAEGWEPVMKTVPRTESFSAATVTEIKELIEEEYFKDTSSLKALILVGRVAVPYSGKINIDGHSDHNGAWPADAYYGIFDGTWTDTSEANTSGAREVTHNLPGDGKFDQTLFPADVKLQIGRIDFYNLTDFSETEIELYKRYFDKNHIYRTGQYEVAQNALLDDNFGMYSNEAFAANGWLNFYSLVGNENIFEGDMRDDLESGNYLFAYGCGSGSYNSIQEAAYSFHYADTPQKTVFTLLFGSYAGDWDSENNVLRSAIASQPSILTSAWAGRPFWFFQHMIFGKNIGFSYELSANNKYTYPGSGKYGHRMLHIALIGDPTLNMYPAEPLQGLNIAEAKIENGIRKISLEWDSPEYDVIGYNLYRADENGDYEKLNTGLITETFYSDESANLILNTYLVRPLRYIETITGSFYMFAPGAIVSHDFHGNPNETYFFAHPNPASEFADIYIDVPESGTAELDIFDIKGRKISNVYHGFLNEGPHKITWNLRDNAHSSLASGVYYARLVTERAVKTLKILIVE